MIGLNNVSYFFSFPFRYKQEKDCSWTDTSIVLRNCSHPPHHLLLLLVASSSCQHGKYVPPLAVPLTSTLDHHHGEKTQKEINLAAQAVCSMDSFLELWTWNAVSSPLTLNQVLAAHFSSVSAHLMLELYWSASNRYLVLRHNSKCSCFLCGHPCFWGCWWASYLWWGWNQQAEPNLALTTPPTLSRSLRHPGLTAPPS